MKNVVSKTSSGIQAILVVIISGIFLSACSKDEDPKANVSKVTVTDISPESPATLKFYNTGSNDRVVVSYTYTIVEKEGVRIFVQPYTNGSLTPGYIYGASPLFTETGTRTVHFSVKDTNEPPVTVDQIRVAIITADATTKISDQFIDVDFEFGD